MTAAPAFFGKLPSHSDFLRGGASDPPMVRLIDWLEQGLQLLHRGGASAELPGWRANHELGFFFADAGGVTTGLLAPSSDRVGRKYPFLLCLPAGAADLSSLPGAARGLLHACAHAVRASRAETADAGARADAIEEVLRTLPCELDEPGSQERVARYLAETHTDRFFREETGLGELRRRSLLLLDLKDALSKYPPRYALRIPASGQPEALAFWIRLVTAWSPRRRPPILCTWSLEETLGGRSPATQDEARAPGRGSLCMVFDELAPRYFEAVLDPCGGADAIFDLGYAAPPQSARQADADALFETTLRSWASLDGLLATLIRLVGP